MKAEIRLTKTRFLFIHTVFALGLNGFVPGGDATITLGEQYVLAQWQVLCLHLK